MVRNSPSSGWHPIWVAELARVLGNPDAFVAVFMAAVAVGGLWLGADAWLAYGGSIILLVLYAGLQGLRMHHSVKMAKHALRAKYSSWEGDLADLIVEGSNATYRTRLDLSQEPPEPRRLRQH